MSDFKEDFEKEFEEDKEDDEVNDEFFIKLYALLQKYVYSRNDEDFVLNPPQMIKLIKVIDFFTRMAEECRGEVEPVVLLPRERCGGVTATYSVLDIYGKDIREFSQIISYTSAITVDCTQDRVCISANVPDVFVEKNPVD
ncbi:MAG: hypothetical protein ACI4GA_07130 [Acutalibacteraceae bacterium]